MCMLLVSHFVDNSDDHFFANWIKLKYYFLHLKVDAIMLLVEQLKLHKFWLKHMMNIILLKCHPQIPHHPCSRCTTCHSKYFALLINDEGSTTSRGLRHSFSSPPLIYGVLLFLDQAPQFSSYHMGKRTATSRLSEWIPSAHSLFSQNSIQYFIDILTYIYHPYQNTTD